MPRNDHNRIFQEPYQGRRLTQSQRKKLWRRRRLARFQRILIIVIAGLCVAGGISVGCYALSTSGSAEVISARSIATVEKATLEPASLTKDRPVFALTRTVNTVDLTEEVTDVISQYVCLYNMSTGEVLAQRDAQEKMYPASMTKLLTLLVAVENLTDLDQTFTMTIDITDYCYINGCSVAGFAVGETIPIQDLLYGCILPSGADACLALAELSAGSQEAFVDLMNQKLEQLGISDTTHFTNCIGLYDDDHYSTVQDIGLILRAALSNETCRTVLTTKAYKTSSTADHPDGITLSNMFIRRIDDSSTGAVKVTAAKTGYVPEAGNCAASYGVTEDGAEYICVTGLSSTAWQAVHDHEAIYSMFCS